MDVFIHSFVTVSPRKVLGRNCSEIHLAGTTLQVPFLPAEENVSMDSVYGIGLKEIKSEIDTVKRSSKTIIFKNGEPCLQKLGLETLAAYVKKQKMFCALETYGTKPQVLKRLIDKKLVDIVTLKLYAPLTETWMKKLNKGTLLADYSSLIADVKESISLLEKSRLKVHVKTAMVPNFLYRKNDLSAIFRSVRNIKGVSVELTSFPGLRASFVRDMKAYLAEKYPTVRIV